MMTQNEIDAARDNAREMAVVLIDLLRDMGYWGGGLEYYRSNSYGYIAIRFLSSYVSMLCRGSSFIIEYSNPDFLNLFRHAAEHGNLNGY